MEYIRNHNDILIYTVDYYSLTKHKIKIRNGFEMSELLCSAVFFYCFK